MGKLYSELVTQGVWRFLFYLGIDVYLVLCGKSVGSWVKEHVRLVTRDMCIVD